MTSKIASHLLSQGRDRGLGLLFLAVVLAFTLGMASFSISAAQEPTQPVAPNAAPPGDQPKIELLNPVYDFGSVLQGQQVNHSFKIKNSGRGDLVINKVQTSCGCTVAEPTKKRLKQGEEAEIGVMFDTRHQKGHRVRTITALTNDPQMSNAAMTLQGDVKVEVEATPEEVSFDKVRFGSDQSRQVEVNYLGGAKDFKVSGVSNTSPNIKVTQEPAADAKSGAKVKVDLLKTMPVGPFDDTIEIATNRQPLQVHVFGEVVGDLTVEPAQVSFGIVPHGQGVMRIVRLTNSGPNKVQVTGVATTNQSVTANVDSIAPGKEYKITIQLRKGTPDGQLRGALKITTDNPNQAALTVPFYAIVGSFEG